MPQKKTCARARQGSFFPPHPHPHPLRSFPLIKQNQGIRGEKSPRSSLDSWKNMEFCWLFWRIIYTGGRRHEEIPIYLRDVFVLNSTNDIWLKNPAWIEKLKQTVAMFKASGVNCMLLNTEIKGEFNIRIAGKLYTISGTKINELNNCT